MINSYEPLRNKEEHDIINKVTAELVRLETAAHRVRVLLRDYIDNSHLKRRKDDE